MAPLSAQILTQGIAPYGECLDGKVQEDLLICVYFIESLLLNDPVFDNSQDYFLSPEEAYENNVRKAVHFLKKRKELNLDQLTYPNAIRYASG